MGRRSFLVLSALALTWQQVKSQDTAALIVGGLSYDELDAENNPTFTASVELFGCPDRSQDSYQVDDYPFRNAFTAGLFYGEVALSCGGFGCENDACDGTTDECFSWGPRNGNEDQWQSHSNLFQNTWNFVIVEAPDLDSQDTSTLTLVAIGPDTRTQIYNPDGSWREYRRVPVEDAVPWSASRCVVQVGSDVYHIDQNVYRLDTLEWEVEPLGSVPIDLAQAERCTAHEIYGRPGVLLKSGFWYDIERRTWEEMAFPPDSDFIVESPNSAFSFRGKMTIFGNPLCDSEGNCRYADVVQYDEVENVWMSIGNMIMSREGLDVIEVPAELCDDILGPSEGTTHASDTTADPSTTDPPIPGEGTDNVAMIVGGIIGIDDGEIVPSVELFGCPGYQGQSLPLEDYPLNIFLTGGMYWEAENKVLVCGGSSCPAGSEGTENCEITTDCYEYTPGNGWQNFSSLERPKWSHIMANIININDEGSDDRYPAVIGLDLGTEIYNTLEGGWESYENAPDTLWRTVECLIQFEDYIYNLRFEFTRLNTLTWETETLEVPPFLRNGNTCAAVRINGFAGITFFNFCLAYMYKNATKLIINSYSRSHAQQRLLVQFPDWGLGIPIVSSLPNLHKGARCSIQLQRRANHLWQPNMQFRRRVPISRCGAIQLRR